MAGGTGGLTKIPEGANPYRAIVNGVEHDYEAGSQAPVAPGVEELIAAADNFPPAAEEVQPPFAGGGGGGGVLVVNLNNGALDKTWQEIHDAMLAGGAVVFSPVIGEVNIVTSASYVPKERQYVVESAGLNYVAYRYVTSTADGYPVEQTE